MMQDLLVEQMVFALRLQDTAAFHGKRKWEVRP